MLKLAYARAADGPMQDLSAIISTLQYCHDSMSVFSHPAHKQRLIAVMQILQNKSKAEQQAFLLQIARNDYLFTLSVCRKLAGNDAARLKHLARVEQFLLQTPDDDTDESNGSANSEMS